MKKYLIGFARAFMIVFMCSFAWRPTYGCGSNSVEVTTKNVHGHEYIVVVGTTNSSYGGTRVAIVHAESCSCKRK